MRRPRVRPPDVRLLGGRRARFEGGPAGLAGATDAGSGALPAAGPGQPVPRRTSRRRRSRTRSPSDRGAGTTRSSTTTMARRSRTRSPRDRARPGGRARRAAQAAAARPRPRRGRQLREGPRSRRRPGRVLPVRSADRVSAGTADTRPVSARCRPRRCRRSSPASRRRPPRAARAWRCRSSQAVCDDLAARGFAAVEAYPEVGARPDATSAATPAFWEAAGFGLAIADERFPVMRRELA